MNFIRLFTSFSGRIPRSSYWLGFAVIVVVFGLGRYAIKSLTGAEMPGPDSLVVMLWTLVGMISFIAVIVKRLHDRDWPSWLGYLVGAGIVLPIPASYFGFYNDLAHYSLIEHIVFWPSLLLWLFAFIENGFRRGTPGPNRHGPQPGAKPA